MGKERLLKILENALLKRASDVHISVNLPPILRVNGELVALSGEEIFTVSELEEIVLNVLKTEQIQKFRENGEIDFAYSIHGLGRFRVNLFMQRGTPAFAIRIIPDRIPSFEELQIPPILKKFALLEKGLIIVTGPTGSGKSTTLAAIIDFINSQKNCHIVTIEDPIEYLHRHNKSIIHQREVGEDTKSFDRALISALREDPDVIMIGEMRDLNTMASAITAAETGHLVMSTLHTSSAIGAIERIVDIFPPHQQNQIRVQLSDILACVIAQRLLPRADGKGRIAAFEILVATPAVKNLIREGKTHQLLSAMQTGAKFGMQTMEQSLQKLLEGGLISKEVFENYLREYSLVQ
ncbi:MAG: type IV pilus twitching motility protein PilT [Thermovenabulum sp.]|uniref:type IV pilus twitching motility protein PilT n=1 Tax=Thermovenabulum sp. TaxID=3100335 RepID=UPI003C7D8C63